MSLLPQEIIRKKRTGGQLTSSDIAAFFGGYSDGTVADYQVGAMLMAILLKGMTPLETSALTLFMRDSGLTCSWGGDKSRIVDKHSTGGVGDKTSLIVLPLCLLEGLRVPMIAGRGLGHTGGTLDKLESIPGMNVYLPAEEMQRLMRVNGGVFMGQTSEIAPLDKRLYAMRDVTDTVESIPLITASILSKKLAEGIGALVMDVKFGCGAFMEQKEDALRLAESISAVGQASGVKVRCVLSDMNSALGDRAGNSLEIAECLEVLQGGGPLSTRSLTLDLVVEMLLLADPLQKNAAVRQKLAGHLDSGRAFEVFCKIIGSQGGDVSVLENPAKLPQAKFRLNVVADRDGFISSCDVRALGLTIIELGGGRRRAADKINLAVGLSGLKRVGDRVIQGESLAVIHAETEDAAIAMSRGVLAAFTIATFAQAQPLVWRIV
ncbi:MAG: thymidine phosphorylase [Proteobacteria bacterium]|nr:thymidine phosphorylase [Pseudomonadota bacterium]